MARKRGPNGQIPPFLPLLLILPLAGCFADQKAQLAACEGRRPQDRRPGQPFKAIQACMDEAGYRFIGWDDGVVCGMGAVIRGQSPAGGLTRSALSRKTGWRSNSIASKCRPRRRAQLIPPTDRIIKIESPACGCFTLFPVRSAGRFRPIWINIWWTVISGNSDTAVLMLFTALVGIALLPPIWFFEPAVLKPGPGAMLVMTVSGILYMGAMLFYLRAIQSEEASMVAPLFQASTLFTFLLGWLFLHETLGRTRCWAAP